VADAYDNALTELVIGLFNAECMRTTVSHHGPCRNFPDVERATASWVDWWTNRRLHGSLEHLTPAEFENVHYAALNRDLQPA
jgi:putative transposase